MLAPHDAPADTPHHRPCHRSHPQQPRTPQPQTRPPRQPHQPQPPDRPHHHDHRQHLDAPSSPTPHSPGNQEQPHPNPPTPPQNENRDNPAGIPIETLQTICSQNFRSSMTTIPDRIQAARRIGLSCTSRTTPSSDSRRNVSLVQKCPTRGPDDRARRRRTDLDAEPDRSRRGTGPISTRNRTDLEPELDRSRRPALTSQPVVVRRRRRARVVRTRGTPTGFSARRRRPGPLRARPRWRR